MKLIKLLLVIVAFISCASVKNKNNEIKQRNYFIIGKFNGNFISIKNEYNIEQDPTFYEYSFDKETNSVTTKKDGKLNLKIFYDKKNLLDSVIDFNSNPLRTTFYYKTSYNEFYAHYSIEDGTKVDYIKEEIDTLKNSVTFFQNEKINSIDSFDLNKNLIKKYLLDSQTYQTYVYDTFGNIKNEFIKLKINNKDSLFNIVHYNYEYDKLKNWTLKTSIKNYLNGKQLIIKTKRIIKY